MKQDEKVFLPHALFRRFYKPHLPNMAPYLAAFSFHGRTILVDVFADFLYLCSFHGRLFHLYPNFQLMGAPAASRFAPDREAGPSCRRAGFEIIRYCETPIGLSDSRKAYSTVVRFLVLQISGQ